MTDRFVEDTGEGYALKEAGLKVIYTIIAGSGFDRRSLGPTEIDMDCYHCGAPVELRYDHERLHWICTGCEGNYGPESALDLPAGTLMAFTVSPAALAERSPDTLSVVGTVTAFKNLELLNRGVCPECSGPVESTLDICDDHEVQDSGTCDACGTPEEVRVRYVCSVCKNRGTYAAPAAVHGHPAVVTFCYEHGIDRTFDQPADVGRFWHHLYERGYARESVDPIRIRVSIPAGDDVLELLLDETLAVIEVAESAAT